MADGDRDDPARRLVKQIRQMEPVVIPRLPAAVLCCDKRDAFERVRCGGRGTGSARRRPVLRFVRRAYMHSQVPVLVSMGGYVLLKKVLAICVGAMFATITLTAFLLAPDWAAVGRGLVPSLPPSGVGWTVALIGAIGGTMAIISYGYWIRAEAERARTAYAHAGSICCCPMR